MGKPKTSPAKYAGTGNAIVSNIPSKNLSVKDRTRLVKAQAKSLKRAGKAELLKEKANYAIAKGKTARTRARAAAFAAAAGSAAQGYAQAAQAKAKETSAVGAALSKWNEIINANSDPAEGTGQSSPGQSPAKTTTGTEITNPLGIHGN